MQALQLPPEGPGLAAYPLMLRQGIRRDWGALESAFTIGLGPGGYDVTLAEDERREKCDAKVFLQTLGILHSCDVDFHGEHPPRRSGCATQ